ncbi:competence protein CoiA family protein [Massilia putida]|uniref:competence protein CoiA family protein n=1 Tax=Massilia putida TaxID=1141883 RepID=UPI0012ECB48B|nr:hypothetical protein [Massilia putida]
MPKYNHTGDRLPLTAVRTSNGEIVEAFDLTAEQWSTMKAEPPGSYLIRRSRLPAILKQNLRGTRWFAARPGESDSSWKPTSPEHEFAQIRLVKALRVAGVNARIEEPGDTPAGEKWEADVYIEDGSRKIAIEVQVSQQTFDEYVRRSEKYRQSGVKVVWLVNNRHFRNFTLGCLADNGRDLSRPGGPVKNGEQFSRHFPAFPLTFKCPKGQPTDDAVRVSVFLPPEGWPVRELCLDEFAVALAKGALTHAKGKFWVWTK